MIGGEEPAQIELGTLGAPFGVRGWIKVTSHIEPPERIFDYPLWNIARGDRRAQFRVDDSGRSSGRLTVKLAGVDDRDAAAALNGAAVLVPRSQLPAPREKEFFRADLLGCEVRASDGRLLGTVAYFIDTPAHALMAVEQAGEGVPRGAPTLIPAVPRHIKRVDLAARSVVVDWDDDPAG